MFHINPPQITAAKRFPCWDVTFNYISPKRRILLARSESYKIELSSSDKFLQDSRKKFLLSFINTHLYKMGKLTARVVEEEVHK